MQRTHPLLAIYLATKRLKNYKDDKEIITLNKFSKRKVLRFFLNNKTVLDGHISKGTVLQIFGAHAEKALSPYV